MRNNIAQNKNDMSGTTKILLGSQDVVGSSWDGAAADAER